jgi:hypothetical protein
MEQLPCRLCGGVGRVYGPVIGDESLDGMDRGSHPKGSYLAYCGQEQHHFYGERNTKNEAILFWNEKNSLPKPSPEFVAMVTEVVQSVTGVQK